MPKVHAYLNFDGDCAQAFEFYQKAFNARSTGTMKFGDMPPDANFPLPDDAKEKVMHTAIMLNETTMLMGSDVIEGFGHKHVTGNSTYVMLDATTKEEAQNLFSALSVNAKEIEMPLEESFFAELYASFQDQFGVWWMIHFEGNKKMG